MSAWNRMMGRRGRRTVRATSVLVTAFAAVLVLSGSEEWIATPLPGGTTIYLRYGAPGGVRIQRGRPPEAAAADSTVPAPAGSPHAALPASPGGAQPGVLVSMPAAWADSLAAQVRRILAEELATLPVSPHTTIHIVRSPAPQAADTLVLLAPPALPESAPDTLAASTGLGFAVPDSAAIPPVLAPPPVDAAIPPVLAPPPVDAAIPPVLAPGPVQTHIPPESPRAQLPPEPRIVREAFAGEGLFTTQLLLFETGASELLPISRDILIVVAGVLREFPEARVRVEGYTDSRGRAEVNLDLSRRRAEAVRDFLAGEGGLGPERVEAVGYGEDHPVIEGSTPTALALNRRVQIRVLNPGALRRSVETR